MGIHPFIIIVIMLLLGNMRGFSQDDTSLTKVNLFFQNLAKNNETLATEVLFKDSISEEDSEKKIQLELRLKNTILNFGNFRSFDIVKEKEIAGTIKYIFGYANFDARSIEFEFVFYKKKEIYQFYNIEVNTDVLPFMRKFVEYKAKEKGVSHGLLTSSAQGLCLQISQQ